MTNALTWLIVILSLFGVILFGMKAVNDSAANRAYAVAAQERARGEARAMIIEAQAESRLHSAQAAAITKATMFPYAILAVAAIFGAVAIIVVIYFAQRETTAPRTITRIERIETRTILILPPGASRREVYRALSAGNVRMYDERT